MVEVPINPTFHIKVKKTDEQSPEYIEYRRKWNENPKDFIVGDFPIHMDIETITECNLRCVMCYYAFSPPEASKMETELFKKVIDEGAEKGLCSIKSQYRGEPLLDDRMIDFITYAKNAGIIEVMFNSNAMLLTKEKAKGLIEGGLDKIICSVDGYTSEIYEQIRIGGKFETVVKNIKGLQELKKEMNSTKPTVRIQMVDTPINHSQIDGYIKFWGDIVEHVAVEDMCDLTLKEEDPTPLPNWACAQIWQRLVVLTDGDVLPCCHALYGGNDKLLVVGNVKEESIESIWKGEEMTKMRELHKTGRSHEIELCRNCLMRKEIVFREKGVK